MLESFKPISRQLKAEQSKVPHLMLETIPVTFCIVWHGRFESEEEMSEVKV
jgi:hypothetical protein